MRKGEKRGTSVKPEVYKHLKNPAEAPHGGKLQRGRREQKRLGSILLRGKKVLENG